MEVIPAVRAGFLVPLAVGTALQVVLLFVLSEFSAEVFAWTFRSPLTAATMGAGYCGGLAMLICATRSRYWVDVRVSYASALLLVALMLLVAVAYQRDTHLAAGLMNAWFFVLAQALAVIVGLVLLAGQLRAPGTASPSHQPRLVVNVLPIAVVAATGIGVGSSPLTGSSSMITAGSPSRAAAMPSRCPMPSENPPTRLPATAVSPARSITSSTRRRGSP
jgi:hypothetical protein